MKTKLLVSLFFVFLFASGISAQQKSSEILGTWKLSSYKYGDREIQYAPDSIQKLKLITPTYFTWVHYMTRNNVVMASAGGTYVLDNGNYVESLEFGSYGMTPYLGKKQTFRMKIEDGKMYLSGNLSDQLKIEEIWEKVAL